MSDMKNSKNKSVDKLDVQKGMFQGLISWITRGVIELITS